MVCANTLSINEVV